MRLIIFAALFLVWACRANAAPPTELSQLERHVDRLIEAEIADGAPSAAMVAVVRGDQAIVKGYGIAKLSSGRKADSQTLFRIGSISKTFLWLAVLKLADEGKIDLDRDVNAYLSKDLQIPGYGAPLTMRDLMEHRSGFEDTMVHFLRKDRSGTRSQWLNQTMPARVAPAGQRAGYSNWGADLASQIVENISGQRFEDYVRQAILLPAGMGATVYFDPAVDNPSARSAFPVERHDGKIRQVDFRVQAPMTASGGISLDARDAATFLRLLLNGTKTSGGRLVGLERWNQATQPTDYDRFVLGFQHYRMFGQDLVGHQGLTRFSSDMAIVPARGLGIFVSFNARPQDGHPYEILRKILAYEMGRSVAADPVTATTNPKPWELAGTYRSTRRSFTTIERFGSLGSVYTIAAQPDGAVRITGPSNPGTYIAVGNDIWVGQDDEKRIRAVRGADGKVVRIELMAGALEPQSRWQAPATFFSLLGGTVALSIAVLLVAGWRRARGRQVEGRWNWVAVATAIIWLALAGAFAWNQSSQLDIDAARESGFPSLSARVAVGLATIAMMTTLGHLVAIVVDRRNGRLGGARLGGRVLYAVVTVAFVALLIEWKVIGATFARGVT